MSDLAVFSATCGAQRDEKLAPNDKDVKIGANIAGAVRNSAIKPVGCRTTNAKSDF